MECWDKKLKAEAFIPSMVHYSCLIVSGLVIPAVAGAYLIVIYSSPDSSYSSPTSFYKLNRLRTIPSNPICERPALIFQLHVLVKLNALLGNDGD